MVEAQKDVVSELDEQIESVRWVLFIGTEIALNTAGHDMTHRQVLEHLEGALWDGGAFSEDVIRRMSGMAFARSVLATKRLPKVSECSFAGFETPHRSMILNQPSANAKQMCELLRWSLWMACNHMLASGREDALVHWRDALENGTKAGAELSAYAYLVGLNLTFGDWSPDDVRRRDLPGILKS